MILTHSLMLHNLIQVSCWWFWLKLMKSLQSIRWNNELKSIRWHWHRRNDLKENKRKKNFYRRKKPDFSQSDLLVWKIKSMNFYFEFPMVRKRTLWTLNNEQKHKKKGKIKCGNKNKPTLMFVDQSVANYVRLGNAICGLTGSVVAVVIFRRTSLNVIDCCRHCSITTVYSINWPNILDKV